VCSLGFDPCHAPPLPQPSAWPANPIMRQIRECCPTLLKKICSQVFREACKGLPVGFTKDREGAFGGGGSTIYSSSESSLDRTMGCSIGPASQHLVHGVKAVKEGG
jgi:hypothetical protein